MKLSHTTITVDNKCLDLLLTDEEIVIAFSRAVNPDNHKYIDMNKCCVCWPVNQAVPCCTFWKKIFGLCEHCEDQPHDYSEEKCHD